MIYLAWIGLFAALTFLGYRSHQYKVAQKLKEDPKFHPAFSNPYRNKSGATPRV